MAVKQGGNPVCGFCHTPLQPTPFYTCITPDTELPVGVGVRICTPACPDRPEGAVVVQRGRAA